MAVIQRRCAAEVDLNFDPDLVKAALEEMPWEKDNDFAEEPLSRRIFIGTVFALCPSGKYYTPWASSNVDPCPKCEGSGVLDRSPWLWPRCQPCQGDGWRFIGELAELRQEEFDTALAFLKKNGWITFGDYFGQPERFVCRVCDGLGKVQPECSTCGGLGSEEAFLDQLWWEQAEALYDSHEFTVESGEGDPCDILAAQYKEEEPDEDD